MMMIMIGDEITLVDGGGGGGDEDNNSFQTKHAIKLLNY